MFQVSKKRIDFYGNVKFKYLDFIGWGSHSDIYKISVEGKNYALKVFNDFYIQEELDRLDEYKEKLNMNIDSFIFPMKLLYVNDEFMGYLMKLCRGRDLSRKNLDLDIEMFAKSSIKLFKDVQKLSELKYAMADNHISNIMYYNVFKWRETSDVS